MQTSQMLEPSLTQQAILRSSRGHPSELVFLGSTLAGDKTRLTEEAAPASRRQRALQAPRTRSPSHPHPTPPRCFASGCSVCRAQRTTSGSGAAATVPGRRCDGHLSLLLEETGSPLPERRSLPGSKAERRGRAAASGVAARGGAGYVRTIPQVFKLC